MQTDKQTEEVFSQTERFSNSDAGRADWSLITCHLSLTPFKWRNILAMLAVIWGLGTVDVQATVYYSKGSLAPNLTTSWNSSRDGTSGTAPANFTSNGNEFHIQNGHSMTTTAAWSVNGGSSVKLEIEGGGTLTVASGFPVTVGTTTTFQIDASGTYVHQDGSAIQSNIGKGVTSFDPASTVILNNLNTTGPSGITFGNLTINFTTDPGSVNCSGGLTTINGNLTVIAASVFNLTAGQTASITIGGDLIIQGGTLAMATGSGGAVTLNVGGNFNMSGGAFSGGAGGPHTVIFTGGSSSVTFTKSAGAIGTLINFQVGAGKTVALANDFPVLSPRSLTVNGTLNCGANNVTGSGAFTLGASGTLGIGSTAGLSSTASTGNIQVTGTRTLPTTANYTYNGTANQVTGNQLPATVNNLYIANTASGGVVTETANTTIGGTLTLTTGALSIGANTLTLNGAISTSSGTLTGGSTSSISFGGSGASTTLPAVASGLQNLTVNRGNGIALGGAVTVSGMLALSSGQVTSAGNLTLGSGATNSLDTGSLDTKPIFVGNLNVSYTGLTATTIGARNEIPTSGNLGTGLLTVNDTGGCTLDSTAGTVSCTGGAVGSGATLTVTTGGVLENAGTFTPTGTLSFTGSGKYQHNQNGGTIPTATWVSTSTCEVIGWSTSTSINGFGQTFGNFTWNSSGEGSTTINLGGNLATVNGTFTVQNTGSGAIRLFSASGNKTCTVAGDVVVGPSGKLDVQNTGSDGVLNIGGNLNVSGTLQNGSTTGTINFTGSSCQFTASGTVQATALSWAVNSGKSLTMNNNLTVGSSQSFTVNGTLNCGANVIGGSGTFTLSSGGTLGIGSTLGITSAGSTGNIQTTTRNFNTTANYTYNGSASQVVGSGLPATVNNLTIANTGSSGNNVVTNAQNTTVNGTLSITSGILDLNGTTLTVANTPSLGGGLQLEIVNGVAVNKLALSSGTLTYGGTLTVANSGALANGNSFTLFTAPGNNFSGWFSSVNLPTLSSGLSWDTNTLRTSGLLSVYSFTTTPLALSTPVNTTAMISAAKLANHASSLGTPTATSVTTPSHGIASVDGSGNLTYTPTTSFSGSDSFTLTFQDGHGSQTMAVSVTVGSTAGSLSVVSGPAMSGGNFQVSIAGIPTTTYTVETNSNIGVTPWVKEANYTTPASGVFQVVDPVGTASQLFYRVVYPSY